MNQKRHLCFALSILFILVFALRDTAFTFSFLNGKLEGTGFLENKTSVRMENGEVNDAWQLMMSRNTIQLEPTYHLLDNVSITAIYRDVWEGSYGIDHHIDDRSKSKMSREMKDDRLRECYMDISTGRLAFRLGKQQVIWGEADGLRMADIINPLDARWHGFFEVWEDLRIPLWMAKASYAFPSRYQICAELVWIPTDFEPARAAPPGCNWSMPEPPPALPAPLDQVLPYVNQIVNDNQPDGDVSECSEVGLRLTGIFGDWELSIFDFYARSDLPVGRIESMGLPTAPGKIMDMTVGLEYERMNVLGGTFNVFEPRTKTVFRGEGSINMREPFNEVPVLIGPIPSLGIPEVGLPIIVKKETINYMLGFDRPTMIDFLNPTRTFFISGQFFHKHILNFNSDLVQAGYNTPIDKNTLNLTLLVNTGYDYDRIMPQALVIYDVSGALNVQSQVDFKYYDSWIFTLGLHTYSGHSKYESLGMFKDNDEIFLRVRYQF